MCTYSTVELFINRETRIELESSLLASLFLLRAGVGTHTVHRVGAGFPFRSAEGRKLLRFYRHLTDGKFYTFTLNPGPNVYAFISFSARCARVSHGTWHECTTKHAAPPTQNNAERPCPTPATMPLRPASAPTAQAPSPPCTLISPFPGSTAVRHHASSVVHASPSARQ